MSPDNATPIVHVVDDDEGIRKSVTFLLRSAGFQVVSFSSGAALLEHAVSLSRGCVITDVRMPAVNGLELQKRLRVLRPDLPVVIMTGHADIPMAVQAMRDGAVEFVEKPFEDEVLIAAVVLALNKVGDMGVLSEGDFAKRLRSLSAREREVLDLLLEGKSNKEIAFHLNISQRTVEVHRAKIMSKMQTHSLARLVRMVLFESGRPPGF